MLSTYARGNWSLNFLNFWLSYFARLLDFWWGGYNLWIFRALRRLFRRQWLIRRTNFCRFHLIFYLLLLFMFLLDLLYFLRFMLFRGFRRLCDLSFGYFTSILWFCLCFFMLVTFVTYFNFLRLFWSFFNFFVLNCVLSMLFLRFLDWRRINLLLLWNLNFMFFYLSLFFHLFFNRFMLVWLCRLFLLGFLYFNIIFNLFFSLFFNSFMLFRLCRLFVLGFLGFNLIFSLLFTYFMLDRLFLLFRLGFFYFSFVFNFFFWFLLSFWRLLYFLMLRFLLLFFLLFFLNYNLLLFSLNLIRFYCILLLRFFVRCDLTFLLLICNLQVQHTFITNLSMLDILFLWWFWGRFCVLRVFLDRAMRIFVFCKIITILHIFNKG